VVVEERRRQPLTRWEHGDGILHRLPDLPVVHHRRWIGHGGRHFERVFERHFGEAPASNLPVGVLDDDAPGPARKGSRLAQVRQAEIGVEKALKPSQGLLPSDRNRDNLLLPSGWRRHIISPDGTLIRMGRQQGQSQSQKA